MVVVVYLLSVSIGFVIYIIIRNKLRKAAERADEIKRLLVFASEEAARAEIEATTNPGYFYSSVDSVSGSGWVPAAPVSSWVPVDPVSGWVQPPQAPVKAGGYECVVCFSPTSTRCAKCKAVRYCSGRCQIVHWRQGHKDECRPYVAVKSVKDVKVSNDISPDKSAREGLHPDDDAKVHSYQPKSGSVLQSPCESSSEEYSTFSTPTRSSETSSGSSEDSDTMDSHQFADVKPEHETVVSPARKSTASVKINQKNFNTSDEDAQPRFSRSSSRGDDGSGRASFSEPSTIPSDFWSGALPSKKSTVDELDGLDRLGFSGDANETMSVSSKVTKIDQKSCIMKGTNITPSILNNAPLNGLGSRKPDREILSSNEILIDGQKSTRPPKSTPEMMKETKVSPPVTGEHSPIKDSKPVGAIPPAIPQRSNYVVENKSVASPALKSTRVISSASKTSDTHLTSSTSRLASQSTKPVVVHESSRSGLKSMQKVIDQFKPSKLTRPCSPRADTDTAHKYSCKGLFSYEMFVKLYNWKQVELRPFGLVNCGNSCYANAVLQCLMYTPPLNAYLLQGFHSNACHKREWCFTCEFEALVLKAKNGYSPLSPIHILSQLESNGRNLGHGKEEDAHEFLRYAIDTLQSVCLREAGTSTSNSLEEETTLIGLTFGGYLRSKIKCMKCGGKSERNERMMDLTVEIEGDIGTLEEALNKFTCTEILDGENKYKCSRCKSYERAKKKLTLLEAPNVLTIALKRFQSGKFGKLNKSIHFPEILDMAPYVSGTSDKSPVYRLYGVVVHVDIMNAAFSGHYVCYVKNLENRWFKMDDTRVKEVDVQSVLTKSAYMLLYARCSPRAPRVIRSLLSRQHNDPKKHKMAPSFTSRSHSSQPWDVNHDHPTIRHRTLEEESSSSSDGSGMFSESCSCSTESSRRDSSSIEDHFSLDWESSPPWRSVHMNSSDSDTSSSSSFPSPLYFRHSQLYNEDDECRKASFSNSYSEPNVDRLGGRPVNPLETSKPTLRRSTTRGRSD
uniref:ubiquitin carboxyl-terminal hydrolase 16-like n=1 Tax=Erigeron canadensis TaxID=72917 RepID=UPI001CB9B1A5|nr:ubiquitin carboxyl-terminal hydrolase 16-like [Erigeron canadensis]